MDNNETFKNIKEVLVKLRNTEDSDFIEEKMQFLDSSCKADFETRNSEYNRLVKEIEEVSEKEKNFL